MEHSMKREILFGKKIAKQIGEGRIILKPLCRLRLLNSLRGIRYESIDP
jgi:hypothetical protein